MQCKSWHQCKKRTSAFAIVFVKLQSGGHPTTIMVAVTNSDDLASVEATASGQLKPGDQFMCLKA